MKLSPMTRLILLAGVAAHALELSGRVVNLDGTPCSRVSVRLAGAGASTLTDAFGNWSLSGTSGVYCRRLHPTISSRLVVDGGRFLFELAGRSIGGRASVLPDRQNSLPLVPIASRLASALPDTLEYSIDGKVFLRDTVSVSRSGIIRTLDTTWNSAIVYGYLTDSRDGQIYRTVKIGVQIWMAENLNFAGANGTTGVCPGKYGAITPGTAKFCAKYGRQYTWEEAMNGAASTTRGKVSGICPVGWHVPTDSEWTILVNTVEGDVRVGAGKGGSALQSRSGWLGSTGTDLFGFTALPAGYRSWNGWFLMIDYDASFWSASEYDATLAWSRELNNSIADVYHSFADKNFGFSLRCSME